MSSNGSWGNLISLGGVISVQSLTVEFDVCLIYEFARFQKGEHQVVSSIYYFCAMQVYSTFMQGPHDRKNLFFSL